jgi:hypothetical protein
VYGPFSRVREAIMASRQSSVHGAILDVNLNGEMVYPLADVLQKQGVPILFVTGYSAESIDPKLPVFQSCKSRSSATSWNGCFPASQAPAKARATTSAARREPRSSTPYFGGVTIVASVF